MTNDQLEKVQSLLLNEFNRGLNKQTHSTASVKMFPTFVRDVPNGKGKYHHLSQCYSYLFEQSFTFFISLLSQLA